MSDDFFGQYLVARDAISMEQLQQAVAIQKQDRLLLGEIAIREKLLSAEQLAEILRLQTMSGLKFGQIAREKGFLSSEQFQGILEQQSSNHVLLGEALVRKGFLGQADLIRHLGAFSAQLKDKEIRFERELNKHPLAPVIQLSLRITQDYLSRLGYTTKQTMLEYRLPESRGMFSFFLEQTTPGGTNYLGLQLSPLGAQTLLGEQGTQLTATALHEEVSQLLFNLNYIICQDLRKQGLQFKHGAVQSHPPMAQNHVCIRLASFIDNLDLSYSSN